jgi:tetratricopeptide (TPR) repeat protein
MSDVDVPSQRPETPEAWLHYGQALEAQGQYTPALSAYDECIKQLGTAPDPDSETRRRLGIASMNRGNVLQKIAAQGTSPQPAPQPAVAAYDQAIAFFQTLSLDNHIHRNHLGAAWLNRGHAALGTADVDAAIASFQEAITHLTELPLDENPAYRLNLAGAWANLAHTQLATDPSAAKEDAEMALHLVDSAESSVLAFADMSLRARRALAMAMGQVLAASRNEIELATDIASKASDVIDDGLALAREWERRGTSHLRPLALRLFRLGAHLYRVHQPQFVAEFVLENLDPAIPAPFSGDAEFLAVADEVLTGCLAELQRPRLLIAGSPNSARLLETAQSLRDAQQRLRVGRSEHSNSQSA